MKILTKQPSSFLASNTKSNAKVDVFEARRVRLVLSLTLKLSPPEQRETKTRNE